MNKIGKLLLFLLVLSGVFGCSSTGTKDMDEKYLSVSAEYKEKGCKFIINSVICSRAISVSNVKQLLETGRTYKIEGFVSPRTGKQFSSYLKLEKDGKAVFDFGN